MCAGGNFLEPKRKEREIQNPKSMHWEISNQEIGKNRRFAWEMGKTIFSKK